MSLKNKVVVILASIMVFSTLAYYGVFRHIVLRSFIELEDRLAERDMNRCVAALEREIKLLDGFVHDWSSWDDSYRFVQDRNGDYIKANLLWQVFKDQKLNFIHVYDAHGRLVWGKFYDLASGKELPLDLSKELSPAAFSRLVHQAVPGKSTSGVIQTSHGTMIVAANPLLTSENKGPSRGAFVMGRLVTREALSVLSEQVNVKLTVWSARGDDSPKSLSHLVDSLSGTQRILLNKDSQDSLSATSIFQDINGDPAIVLQASIPRETMQKGRGAYALGMIFVICAGIIMIGAVSALLRMIVVKPIAGLTENVLAFRESAGDLRAFEVGRNDEIGTLSREFSAMVKVLAEREESLRLEEKRLRQIIDLVPHFIFAKDADGRFILVNKAVADAYGSTVESLTGKKQESFAHSPEELSPIRGDDREVISSGKPKFFIDEVMTDTSGGKRFLQTSKIPFTFSGTSGPAVLGVSVDITGIRLAQEALRKSESQLLQAQKMEIVGQLAGGVAHDLNNMLSPILGYAEMMLQDMRPFEPRYDDVKQIKTAAERARNLTHELLAFSRKQVLEMKVSDIAEVVESYGKMLRRTIREDISIQMKDKPRRGSVRVDVGQIGQVLLNLALNAQDAMPQGGAIVIETSEVVIDDDYARTHQGVEPGPHVLLSFSDTGSGMDSHTLGHIFEPFFTTKDQGKGTGLGLPMVYGIVKQHGGHLNVYSEPGMGTTFKIFLPRVDQSPDTLSGAAPVKKAQRGSETVAVAEDDPGVRGLVTDVLAKQGYTVITSENTDDLMKAIKVHDGPVHLLLTDVVMPDLNGKELYEQIRTMIPGIRVIFMSGYTDDVIAYHGILEEGTHFIQKPFTIGTLTEKMRTVLDA